MSIPTEARIKALEEAFSRARHFKKIPRFDLLLELTNRVPRNDEAYRKTACDLAAEIVSTAAKIHKHKDRTVSHDQLLTALKTAEGLVCFWAKKSKPAEALRQIEALRASLRPA